jgi:hypothetical protein
MSGVRVTKGGSISATQSAENNAHTTIVQKISHAGASSQHATVSTEQANVQLVGVDLHKSGGVEINFDF